MATRTSKGATALRGESLIAQREVAELMKHRAHGNGVREDLARMSP